MVIRPENLRLPCFTDVEASSLGQNSYPIEIAWNLEDGSIESHLINPYLVEEWTDWDPGAQAVHGLSRAYLADHGEHPDSVAHRMNQVLAGKTVYSDAITFDGMWIGELFAGAMIEREFKIKDIWFLFEAVRPEPSLTSVMLDAMGSDKRFMNHVMKAYDAAWNKVEGQRHRAAADVQHRIEWFKLSRNFPNY